MLNFKNKLKIKHPSKHDNVHVSFSENTISIENVILMLI